MSGTGMTLDDLLDAIKERFPTAVVLRKDYEQIAAKYEGNGLKVGWAQLIATWRMTVPPPPSQLLLACRKAVHAGEATIERKAPPPMSTRDVPGVNWKQVFEQAGPEAKRMTTDWFSWNQDRTAGMTDFARYLLLRTVRDKANLVAQRRAMNPGSTESVEITDEEIQSAIDRAASTMAAHARDSGRKAMPVKPLYVAVNEALGRPAQPPDAPRRDTAQDAPAPAAAVQAHVPDPDGITWY